MGMAASQARFLSLTARKSNVEYEGQQVNQQRTILANQTSTLNNQMLELAVPTPPDVNQYYTDQYIFQDGDKTCEIISGLERESMVVRETEKQYNFYRQPCNSGLPVTLSLINAQLMLNGKELNAYNAAASRAQIKSILDSGQAGDQPSFRCYVDNYKALGENDQQISDPRVLKYTNKTSEIALPLGENSDFESNFKNGTPSYSVTTDAQTGQTVYTKLTSENYETEMAKASAEGSNVKIVQETRDKNGNPEKVLLSQAEVNNTTGLELFVGKETQKIYKEYDSEKNQGEQQYASMSEFSASEYDMTNSLKDAINDGDIILLAKVPKEDSSGEYDYKIIRNHTKYEEWISDGAEIVQLVSKEGAGEVCPISDELAETLSDEYSYKTQVLSSENIVEQSFDLTQEMWNQAKATNNQELMNYYIENLDFTSEYASNNILYWYESGSGKRFIQASYIDDAGLDAENTATTIDQIYQEYYEQSFNNNIDHVYSDCVWQKDPKTGRVISVTAKDPDGTTKIFNLTFSKVEDEEGYNQAVEEYEYQKALYDKTVSDINLKTSNIQQKDKSLELRLKSLDTEQEALSKELDAVKKVIENNVQNSFNTFA